MMISAFRVARRMGVESLASRFAYFSTDRSGMTGVVKWFDAKKGFGFIVPDDGSSDVFVHYSVVNGNGFKSLADGEQVEFDIISSDDGRIKATNVTGPDGTTVQGAARRAFPGFAGGGFGGGGQYDSFNSFESNQSSSGERNDFKDDFESIDNTFLDSSRSGNDQKP
eukprot:CAMPEP_0194210500 /NCGR_PEP_ID=MMETSP0156-20130528/8600_1 /TAXON_ID=33649 /ORGANISM="Thalassionema nitzschioides, Strain L26-B" /LENGTH=166 /DNA_ID=CAMNT_0038937853 /DNA_START=58 /DNA_END=558 /DNA_ORIENTATION=+